MMQVKGNAVLVSSKGGQAIRAVLDLSFDGLDTDAKEMFLDIASVCANKPLQYLVAAWESIYHKEAHFHLGNLISAALVSIVNGCVQIHDVLRDLGRKKIQETQEYRGTRVWVEGFSEKPHTVRCGFSNVVFHCHSTNNNFTVWNM